MEIPTFVVFDSDTHSVPPEGEDDKHGRRAKHEQDNTTVLKLHGIKDPVPFPNKPLWRDDLVMWADEIGATVESDFGSEDWGKIKDKVRADRSLYEKGINKNSLFIGYCLAEASMQRKKSKALERL